MRSPIKIITFPGTSSSNITSQEKVARNCSAESSIDGGMNTETKQSPQSQSLVSLQQYMNFKLHLSNKYISNNSSQNSMTAKYHMKSSTSAGASTTSNTRSSGGDKGYNTINKLGILEPKNRRSTITNTKRRKHNSDRIKRQQQQQQLFDKQQQMASIETVLNTLTVDTTAPLILSPLFERILQTIQYSNSANTVPENTIQLKNNRKKKVRFAIHRNTIILPSSFLSSSSNNSSDSTTMYETLWYTATDYTTFRSDANDMAAYAMGDVDYQQFFLNTLYPYCSINSIDSNSKTNHSTKHICNNNSNRSIVATEEMTASLSPDSQSSSSISSFASDSDSTCSSTTDSTSSTTTSPTTAGIEDDDDSCRSLQSDKCTKNETSDCSIGNYHSLDDMITKMMMEDDQESSVSSSADYENKSLLISTELEMISKYRGLERIIYRSLLFDLKVHFIQECIKELEAEDCYYDKDDVDNDNNSDSTSNSSDDDNNNNSTTTTKDSSKMYRHYMYVSNQMALFFGHVDHYIVQQNKYHDDKMEYQEFLLLQQVRININHMNHNDSLLSTHIDATTKNDTHELMEI